MRRDGDSASIKDGGAFGVQRAKLLTVLHGLAVEAGVQIEAGVELSFEQASAAADVVVFAEGVGSHGRQALAETFGARVQAVPMPYVWCGARLELDAMTLDLRRTPDGIFCGHVMPYGNGNATFQVDTLPETLVSAGLPAHVEISGPPDASDELSLNHLSAVFAPLLEGGQLLGNRSRWSTFQLVECERWSTERFVLIGDAAHTAHYTVGSGTRMAMEDAIVLSEALAGEGSAAAAFASYEAARRPAVEHLQWRAARSQHWWGTLPVRYELPLPLLLFSYFTRTGSVGIEELAQTNPAIVGAAAGHERHLPVDDGYEVIETPTDGVVGEVLAGRLVREQDLRASFVEVACDDLTPWSRDTQHAGGGFSTAEQAPGILLTGGDERRQVLDRFDIGEELRSSTGATVAVAVPSSAIADGATAVLARRADLVAVSGEAG